MTKKVYHGSIEVDGLSDVTALFVRMDNLLTQYFARSMDEILDDILMNIPDYPDPPDASSPPPWKTEKQRKYYWWAVGEGIITRPYERTMELAESFRKEVFKLKKHIYGAIYTEMEDKNYSPFVIGKHQQPIHQGRWWLFEEWAREQYKPEITQKYIKAVYDAFKKFFKRGS